MKKLLTLIVLMLALNFLAAAGGVAWLFQSGHLDRDRIQAIKGLLFPTPVDQPTTQPSPQPATQPTLRLEELLAKTNGRSAGEQVEFIQHAFDAQMVMLDRRKREIDDLRQQVELSKQQMTRDKAALDAQRKMLDDHQQQAARLASDQGFQDSLNLYNSMPAAQVKRVFAGLDDQTVTTYLEAMQPKTAAKIIKEFKSQDETDRIQHILERMRTAQASATLKG